MSLVLSVLGPFIFSLLVFACTETLTQRQPLLEVRVHDTPREDRVYRTACEGASRSAEVYRDFETKFVLHATYFSPSFRSAFDTRLNRLMGISPFSPGEESSSLAFFISVYAPESQKVDLTNPNLWSVVMQSQGQEFRPSVVRYLPEKIRWLPYFSYINKWSKEYLIIFSASSFPSPSEQLLAASSLQLRLANAEAAVMMSW